MNHDPRPIGVFDSGVGGLTVLKSLLQKFPQESFIYLGDTARLPYGSKSPLTIRKYSEQNLNFLIKKNIKAAVIACNSASTQMKEKEFLGTPIYNVIDPSSEWALKLSSQKRIGVLGTRATIQSEAYDKALRKIEANTFVLSQACPLFVPLAEEALQEDPLTNLIVYRYLQPLLNQDLDTVILGCTHYPILKSSIQKVFGSQVMLVDSGDAITEKLKNEFSAETILPAAENSSANLLIFMTDESKHTYQLAAQILSPFSIDQMQVADL